MFKKINKTNVTGDIKAYGLVEWWLTAFDDEERELIRKVYKPLSVGFNSDDRTIDKGSVIKGISRSMADGSIVECKPTDKKLDFLGHLMSWFTTRDYRIAKKIMNEALKYEYVTNDILDRYFFYQQMINFYYKYRKLDEEHLDKLVEYCLKQIDIAEESHKQLIYELGNTPKGYGCCAYNRLSVIYQFDKKYKDLNKLEELTNKMKSIGFRCE